MLNELDNFYFSLPEPDQSTYLFLRCAILDHSKHLTEHYKFKTAFFHYKGKWFCYFGIEKKSQRLYIGFIKGSQMKNKHLFAGNRTMIKILYIDKQKDIDLKILKQVLKEAEGLM
jgi:hypothetical protein